MLHLLSLIVMHFAFASVALSPAGCLEVLTPGTAISSGTYSCVVVGREATGSTLNGLVVEDSPGNGIEIYADKVTLRNVTVRRSAGVGLLVGCHWQDGRCTYTPREIVIEGGLYTENADNGIRWDLCASCVIRNARVSYNRNCGMHISDTGGGPFLIENCEIDNNGLNVPGLRPHGIYTGEPGRFHRNRIHHNAGYGIHVWPGPGPRTTPETPLDIRLNRIYQNGSGGTVIGGTQGTVVYWHNTEYDNGDSDMIP